MLRNVLQQEQPATYLVIGDPAPLEPQPDGIDGPAPAGLSLEGATPRLPDLGRQDLVLVGGLESLARKDGEILLSRLRDVYARRVLARVVLGGTWQQKDMTAFGFTRLAEMEPADGVLYGFDVASYKTTPDWLNPRFWANPELWDKYRW
ncbi:hypothetical protein SAMN04488052_101581 [Aquisalimonas asiatica]|uniref:Uncharacterized protein n=2 Tax=Aquisalimonas asiatica TaxID=406100 RepID=A0A1H8QHH9_9GAMM|nr:hypothetical protein SAMN04488052_101581 [Aquisalimonas asiatica]